MDERSTWEVGDRDLQKALTDSLPKIWSVWREIDGDYPIERFLEMVNHFIPEGFSGVIALNELCEELDAGREPEGGAAITIFGIAVGFFCDASRANDEGNQQSAWSYLTEALYWAGYAQGGIEGVKDRLEETRHLAQRAAFARHAENRALKDELRVWFDTNRAHYKSLDAAAEASAGVVVPVVFRTARKWLSEFTKK